MSEEAADTIAEYGKLIEEVFIKPIRTVVVVDDEFPTLDALLNKEMDNPGLGWKPENVKLAREIIDFCRDETRCWLADIHDGPQSSSLMLDGNSASHLHQSDLMILDYHLDKARPNDGSNAISILRELADNDYFNLAVVYTKGDQEAGGDIARVVREIAVGLCSLDNRLMLGEKSLQDFVGKLEKWEDDVPDIEKKLLGEVDDGIYLKARPLPQDGKEWDVICSFPELQGVKALVDNAPVSVKFKQVVKWALHRRQQVLASKLATVANGNVLYSPPDQHGTNWIRTDRLFVTVVSKSNEPSSLPDKLLTALRLWMPEPHRLLMSKMRAELDERGVLAEGEVLGNRCLQAGWMDEFLTEDSDERAWKIHNTINRHWEGLGDAIRSNVTEFAERLTNNLITDGRDKAIENSYQSLERADVQSELNRYLSCKPAVEGGHLTTGHVLRLDNCNGEGCYWLCLSPACDLVPGQKSAGWPKRLGDHTPFIAVQLFATNREEALRNAFGGNHLFVQVDDELKCFSFTPSSQANDTGADRTPSPKWEQMFAARKGKFAPPNKGLMVSRASDEDGTLSFDTHPAQIVAHLRYEYALNLLQRLGANLSRVGLDFIGMTNASVGDGQTNP